MFITDRAPIATAEFNDCWCTLMGIKQTISRRLHSFGLGPAPSYKCDAAVP